MGLYEEVGRTFLAFVLPFAAAGAVFFCFRLWQVWKGGKHE